MRPLVAMRPCVLAVAVGLAAPLAAAFDATAFAVAPPFDPFGEGLPVANPAIFPTDAAVAVGGAYFGDGTLLVAYEDRFAHVSADLTTVHSVTWMDVVSVAVHPDGEVIVLNYDDDTVYKYLASGTTLLESSDSNPSECDGPTRAVVQQTGNQRIFVLCVNAPDAVCQYDADMTGRTCTSVGVAQGLGIAPDDSFLIIRDDDALEKYTINNGAGTLTPVLVLFISGSTTAVVFSLVVLSDYRIVIPDSDNDELEWVNAAFDTVTTINVNGGSLGGITPSCDSPEEVAVDPAGTGDVFVACDTTDSILILSNDLSTTAVELASPSDLGLAGDAFTMFLSATFAVLNVADTGTEMFVGGSGGFGFALLSLTGAGTTGMAGSYSAPALALARGTGSYTGATAGAITIDATSGAVIFADNTVAIAMREDDVVVQLSSDYKTVMNTVDGFSQITAMIPHPDNTAIILDSTGDTIYKYTSGLVESASDSNAGECNQPVRAVVQQTGNQRIFVMCVASPDAVCQYDSDLSGRTCTTTTTTAPNGLGIAPDDSFLVIRDDDTLRKYTINDGAGTLTPGATLDISGSTTSVVYSLVVLSDYRIVVPDRLNEQLEWVNAAFDTVTTINVNSGSLGGISPSCNEPEEVATSFAGTGDVVVACDTGNSILILSNDLSTTAFEPTIEFYALGLPLDIGIWASSTSLNVADASGTTMFVGGGNNIVLLDLTGAGTSGLAGSYATPLLAAQDPGSDGVLLGTGSRSLPIDSPAGAVDFGDGSLAVAIAGGINRVVLASSDYSTLLDMSQEYSLIVQMVAHPDNTAIVLDYLDHTIYKLSSDGTSLTVDALDSNSGECAAPARAVVQQTGNQRIFVMCVSVPDAVCQYDSDLSGRTCTTTTTTSPQGLGIAPDDSFLVIRDDDTLRKYTINDGAGTLTPGATLDISGSTTDAVFSLAVLSDFRILVPDGTNDQLEWVNAAFDTVTSIDVNSGSLGGITPSCDNPTEVVTDSTGAGDVVLSCEDSDNLLVLSNDLSTTALMVGGADFGDLLAPVINTLVDRVAVAFMPSGELFVGGDNFFRITGDPPVGAGGDPVVTDLAGHTFVVGTEPFTEYSLLRSPDGADEVLFRTSDVMGRHDDYFIDTITLVRKGCGSVTLRALPRTHWMERVGETSACMEARLLHGDNGLTAAAVGDGSVAVVVIPHHQESEVFSFLNIKIAGDVAKLRREGWQGVLGDEAHSL